MGWNLPPGCTDRDVDNAAPGNDMANAVQCDNCKKMFDPEEDQDCLIGFHPSFGDCCQCGECVEKARAEVGFPFSGSF